MKTASAAHMRAIDRAAITDFGIPGIVLMENAGRAVADAAESLLVNALPGPVSLVCGAGNNGGDGFVAARHLHNHGYQVEVVLLRPPESLKGDAATAIIPLQRMRVPICRFGAHTAFTSSRLIVDALLGTGTAGEITGTFHTAIEEMNAAQRPILAVDLPSGLDPDTGEVRSIAVRAHTTITLCLPKPGLLTPAGTAYAGIVRLADIGIPAELLR